MSKVSYFQDLLTSIFERGATVTRQPDVRSLESLASALMSEQGEVSGHHGVRDPPRLSEVILMIFGRRWSPVVPTEAPFEVTCTAPCSILRSVRACAHRTRSVQDVNLVSVTHTEARDKDWGSPHGEFEGV